MAKKRFAGIFPIMQTPFNPDGSLDEESLRREVEFCLMARVHGVVIPAWASEFHTLRDAERERVVSIVVEQVGGRLPVVAGTSGPSTEAALYHSRRAQEMGADSVMVMPPYVRHPTPDGALDLYRRLADAVSVPITIQNSPPVSISPQAVAKLVREVSHTWYVKEEVPPTGSRISALLKEAGDGLAGVFGGWAGLWLVYELERGSCGNMPATHIGDLHARIYEAFISGDRHSAYNIYRRVLPLIALEQQHPFAIPKVVLKYRGVFSHARYRDPGETEPDALTLEQVQCVLEELKPLLIKFEG